MQRNRRWSAIGTGVLAMLALLCLAPVGAGAAVSERLQCERLGMDDGLSQLSITAAVQDAHGFLWFGTQAGLNRYDGYEFRVFTREFGDSYSIPDSYVQDLASGEDGQIWVATLSGGLALYDPRLDRFQTYSPESDQAHTLTEHRLSGIELDEAGRIWIGSWGGGLSRLNPASGEFEHWRHDPDDPNSLGSDAVRELYLDAGGTLWIGTNDGLFARRDDRFESRPLLPGESNQPVVTAIAQTPDGALWLGSETDGLFRLDEAGHLRRFQHEDFDPTTLAHDQVETLFVDDRGNLWVGTTNGLSTYDSREDRFVTFRFDPLDEGSLPANRVASVLQDRSGLLWFGTWTGGLCKHNSAVTRFMVYRQQADDPLSLPDNRVRDFYEDGEGQVWVAMLGGGLARFDPEAETFQPFRHDPFYPSSIGSDDIHAIAGDAEGYLWIGSRNAGIDRFDPRTGSAIRFGGDAQRPGLLESDHVLDLLVDDRQRLWIGTWDGGLSRLDIATGQLVTYRHDPDDPNSIASDSVGILYQGGDGGIWIGTRGAGLLRYRAESDDFERIAATPERPDGLRHGVITSITEDADGALWVASQGGGVARMDPEAAAGGVRRFRSYTHDDGLAGNAVGAIVFDETGSLWISTLLGLSKLDPGDGTIVNFYPVHGVQRSSYYVGAGLRTGEGQIYFGGIDGFTRFTPVEFPVDTTPPQVVITSLLISNRSMAPSWRDPGSPLDVSIEYADHIDLNYDQRIFSFEFSGLHFVEPSKNRYFYMLEGFDDDWVETDASRRYATYTDLDDGRYVFRVRASNRDGVLSPEEARLAVTVRAPPWETWWAYLGYLTVAGLLLGAIAWQRWRVLSAEREAQRLVQESEEQLKQALWGSGDDFWILDLRDQTFQRMNAGDALLNEELSPVDSVDAFWGVVHPEDAPGVREAMMAHVKGESPYFEALYRVDAEDGTGTIWALSKGRVQERDSDGFAVKVSGATKNVTPLKRSEEALRELNEKLESIVEERTADLREANASLRETLDQLRQTQNQLVESEKMASLGGLVAGVAHEINTPLGVAVTAASHLEKESRLMLNLLDEAGSDPDKLAKLCDQHLQNTQFILRNLRRAADLIRSFKQVAVDQSTEDRRQFNLNHYLHEILVSLQPRFKRTRHVVNVDCSESLVLDSFPGAIYQIVTNLVMNSLVHGFADDEEGRIDIGVEEDGDQVVIRYRDDGRGFGPEVQRRIFEPFFTTRRSKGGSGLGMHIVYNLVTQVLQGVIECEGAPGEGVSVVMRLPARASKESAA